VIKFVEDRLVEMAKLKVNEVPSQLLNRTTGIVLDQWFLDSKERHDLYKVAFEYDLVIKLQPYQSLEFYYGFTRSYQYAKSGKATGAKNAPKYEFRAIHIISKILGAEGQWYRNDCKDEDFEKMVVYEDHLDLNTLDGNTVRKLVRDLKLKAGQQNILSILDKLL
jgi:hypothetical protein